MTETPGSHPGRPRRGAEGGRPYVVLRTRGIRLGTPYVIAEWIDASIGGLPRSAEAFTEDEMHCDPRLGTALEAWRADDGMGSSPGCGSSRSVITLGDRATMRCIECRAGWDWSGTEAVAAVPDGHGRGVPR